MKFTERDTHVLTHLGRGCRSVVLQKNMLATNEERSALFAVKLETEELQDQQIGIYEMLEFLSVLKFLGSDYDITVEEDVLKIRANKTQIVYYTTPLNCLVIPKSEPQFPFDEATKIVLSEPVLKRISGSQKLLGNDRAVFGVKGKKVMVRTETHDVGESSHMQLDLSEYVHESKVAKGKFRIMMQDFNLLDGDHELYFAEDMPFIAIKSSRYGLTTYLGLAND